MIAYQLAEVPFRKPLRVENVSTHVGFDQVDGRIIAFHKIATTGRGLLQLLAVQNKVFLLRSMSNDIVERLSDRGKHLWIHLRNRLTGQAFDVFLIACREYIPHDCWILFLQLSDHDLRELLDCCVGREFGRLRQRT